MVADGSEWFSDASWGFYAVLAGDPVKALVGLWNVEVAKASGTIMLKRPLP